MRVELVEDILVEEDIINYDHKKYEVTEGKFKTYVYEHNGNFLIMQTNQFFDKLEQAAEAALFYR